MLIYLVFKNADRNEGRGPMVLDSAYQTREKAREYLKDKLGVQNRSPFWTNKLTGHVSTGWDDPIAWQSGGDWEIKEIELH